MNFPDFDFDHVDLPRHHAPQFWAPPTPSQQSQLTVVPYDSERRQETTNRASSPPEPSLSQPATVIPHAPSPPANSHSPPELYGPDRLFGPPLATQYHVPRTIVRFDEAQLAMDGREDIDRARHFRDEILATGGQVTPGIDDSQYIRLALDALTREDGAAYTHSPPSGSSDLDYDGSCLAHDPAVAYAPALAPVPVALTRDPLRRASARRHSGVPPEFRTSNIRPWNVATAEKSPATSRTSSESAHDHPRVSSKPVPGSNWRSVPDSVLGSPGVDPHRKIYPHLNYKPLILRPFSMIILMILCILMITALIFSVTYADRHSYLTTYGGTIYSGQYFVFRVLPQMLAALILLYAQAIITTSFRIMPFTQMASDDPKERFNAIFQSLYPKSFLWPHLVGSWQIKLGICVTWIINFTLPLQSGAFTVVFVDGQWFWTPVRGVVWTLVVLYLWLVGTLIILMMFWFRRKTGLMWDVRCIADIIPMINRSNTTSEYSGTELLGNKKEMEHALRNRRVDKLGYWQVEDPTVGIWYGIGVDYKQVNMPAHEVSRIYGSTSKMMESTGTFNAGGTMEMSHIRHQYLPWCLRNNQLVYFVVSGWVLLIALFVVSFVAGTRLTNGFKPELSAAPTNGAFSAANFLYSFLPSLLGMVLFLLFQALDQTVRILQPWAELSHVYGAPAERSILLDYAACLPFQAAFKALRNRHWRLAYISLLAALFVFLPILAGGLFMALTVQSSGQVRMFPNVSIFGVLLALLVLYLLGLMSLLPYRSQYRLPHGVASLAEVLSFCANDDFTSEPAFRFPRSKRDLLTRLGVGWGGGPRPVWYFGYSPGRDQRLGVRQLRRYTERQPRGTGSRDNGTDRRSQRMYTEKRARDPNVY